MAQSTPAQSRIMCSTLAANPSQYVLRSQSLHITPHFTFHNHAVLHVDPDRTAAWTDEQVARSRLAVVPGALRNAETAEQAEPAVLSLISTPVRLEEIRKRLGSLIWFMRALNEPIARMANKVDGCTGRFWEGLFKCQALLEEQAVLSAMAYVDLNPVRAVMADTLIESDHTSMQCRLKERQESRKSREDLLQKPLKPVAGLDSIVLMNMTESSYIELVQWTGEQARSDKRGKLKPTDQIVKPPAALWSVAKKMPDLPHLGEVFGDSSCSNTFGRSVVPEFLDKSGFLNDQFACA